MNVFQARSAAHAKSEQPKRTCVLFFPVKVRMVLGRWARVAEDKLEEWPERERAQLEQAWATVKAISHTLGSAVECNPDVTFERIEYLLLFMKWLPLGPEYEIIRSEIRVVKYWLVENGRA